MKRASNQPLGALHIYAGIYLREMLSPDVGTLIPQHTHKWSHISYCAAGAVRVWRGEELLGDFEAPCAIRIEGGSPHRFLTLVPGTLVLCIHAVDETGIVDVVSQNQIPLED